MRCIVQLLGPGALVLVVASAEVAAAALTNSPSSTVLWQLNLGVFGFLQPSATLLFSLIHVAYADVLLAAVLAVLAFVGAARNSKFMLAISNHLSLGCVCIVSVCWLRSGSTDVAALVTRLQVSTDWRLLTSAALVSVSITSAAASQWGYFRDFCAASKAEPRFSRFAWSAPLPALP